MRTPFTILSIATALVSSPLLGRSAPHISGKTNFTKESTMGSHEVVQKPAILVIGIDCRTSNAPEAGPKDIPKLWGRFYDEDMISRIPNKVSNEVIALYCDYEGDYTQPYSVVIGCPVRSIDILPEGMVAKIIPASSYALFLAVGEYPVSLIETWEKIWQEQALERTYTGDYEVYKEKFFSKFPQEVEVYVAVGKNTESLL